MGLTLEEEISVSKTQRQKCLQKPYPKPNPIFQKLKKYFFWKILKNFMVSIFSEYINFVWHKNNKDGGWNDDVLTGCAAADSGTTPCGTTWWETTGSGKTGSLSEIGSSAPDDFLVNFQKKSPSKLFFWWVKTWKIFL